MQFKNLKYHNRDVTNKYFSMNYTIMYVGLSFTDDRIVIYDK